jgi:uncharacterized protein YacL
MILEAVRIIGTPREPGQGVGLFGDGTRVMADDRAHIVGREVVVLVADALRTSVGRPFFAKLSG